MTKYICGSREQFTISTLTGVWKKYSNPVIEGLKEEESEGVTKLLQSNGITFKKWGIGSYWKKKISWAVTYSFFLFGGGGGSGTEVWTESLVLEK
jgi:hypothetical protein